MEITAVNQYDLCYELSESWSPAWKPGYEQDVHEVVLFELETDAGISGVCTASGFAGRMEYRDLAEMFLVGADPRDIGTILDRLEPLNLWGPRPWHFEVACWDILGKDAGKPVYELLGGDGDPIPAYASTGERQPVAERLSYVEDRVSEGFEAVKLRCHAADPEEDIEVARRVREAFPDLTLMMDANMGWSVPLTERNQWTFAEALAVARELEAIGNVGWLEEPLDRRNYRGLARLRERTDVPIAGGEFNNGLHHFREFVRQGSLDVLQPDAVLATGIRNATHVASMAETNGLQFAPHTWNDGLGFAANLHVLAATPARWCEYPIEPPGWTPEGRDFLLSEPIRAANGAVAPPDGPGLGVDLDWDLINDLDEDDSAVE
ncbi:mandelate racemase/muconate lactonizing enzyme family protein [Haloarculaceae archaeon H-GB2-1]|nr:mandelate racemase/muconate lactonizing enzyme family protein [Haloarculaceae archaeon H-GB1-1]MEA5409417.1 mandelate racemase/muconate lactonizing enzyme family protein [Haloarculaceae archaeon H-GB2-1]